MKKPFLIIKMLDAESGKINEGPFLDPEGIALEMALYIRKRFNIPPDKGATHKDLIDLINSLIQKEMK